MPDRAQGQGAPSVRRPEPSSQGRRSGSVAADRHLRRQRLLTALSRAVDAAPVTLVSGPAGSGKTVLASTWARERAASTAVGWISLARDDVEVAEFWTAALTALTGAGVRLPNVPQPVPGQPLPADFIDRLAGALGAAGQVVVVVDEAGHLDGELGEGLDRLLARAPVRLLLVLGGSADQLPLLARYRTAGALAEIPGHRLAFRQPETRELMGRLGTPVSAESAAELTDALGGSPLGARLAAAELARGVPVQRLLADLVGSDAGPVHHLAAAVLAAQPTLRQRFLLDVSVSERLWPDLVQRLTGVPDVDRQLAALADAHAFVETDAGAPGGYRIPGLLRAVLEGQLAREDPQLHEARRRLRSDWYAAAGPLHDGVAPVVPKPLPAASYDGRRAGAPELSPRDLEVLDQLVGGRSTAQIAAALDVSANTVRGHVRTLQRKLAAADRGGIAVRARELGLLQPGSPVRWSGQGGS